MFRVQKRLRFFERRIFGYALTAFFVGATLLLLFVLRDFATEKPIHRDVYLLGASIMVIALTGTVLLMVFRAYSATRDRLAYVKIFAHDILQSLSIGVVTSDLTGTITNVNDRARTLAGIRQDGVQRPFREVLGHIPAMLDHFDRLITSGHECSGVDIDATIDEKEATLRLDGRSLISDTGERIGVILQIQDVTYLRYLDQEMRRTEKLAGLGTLAAGIAHEIKNPLTALSINVQLLEESAGVPSVSTKSDKYLGIIRSEISRLQGIVDKYVSFARPSLIERSPASLEGILDGILGLVEPECRKRRIAISREGFSSAPVRYLLDQGQLQQALLNIVINAIQVMDQGGTLTCRLGKSGSFATVEVVDTGPGIPSVVKDRMFDLFFTTRRGGTGLGLYLTQRIVAEHKGFIDVKTGPSGTTFLIGLPSESSQ